MNINNLKFYNFLFILIILKEFIVKSNTIKTKYYKIKY